MKNRTVPFSFSAFLRAVLFSLLMIIAGFNLCDAEQMIARKIILARFKVKDGNIVGLPRMSPYWPQVDKKILTVDDDGKIYVLNLWNNEILSFDAKGKLQKSIRLQFRLTRADYQNGNLEVSGDGKKFFVYAYDEIGRPVRFIFDQNGKIVKQFPESEIIINFPDSRLCDEPNYIFTKGGILYDQDFKEIKETFHEYSDLEGRYLNRDKKLIKYTNDKKPIWEKQFEKDFVIIGVDKSSNLYLEGILKKGDPYSLYKLNSKGEIIAQAPIPNPFPFLTQKEKDEWEMHSSDEYFSFWKFACNGDIYLVYDLSQLPSLTFKRWLKDGEFFIYKFEAKK